MKKQTVRQTDMQKNKQIGKHKDKQTSGQQKLEELGW